jgi:hypothetical protein
MWRLYRPHREIPYDVQWRKVLDVAIDTVLVAFSMNTTPLAIQTVVITVGVTVLLGLRNPPHSWTSTGAPSQPDFTVATCVDSLLCYRLIRQPKSILQYNPEV